MAGPTEFRPYSMAHYQALAKQITHEGNTDENRIDEVVKNALLSDPDELEKMLLCEGARCFSHQEDAPIHAALEALRQSWDEGVLELTSLRLKEAEQASASALRGNQIIRRGD
ncbi:MAG: hypothetical protein KDK78_00935, partial [Chlamydiia bacterium]|nr:hypothetical protein [Chlamydiia bacterium]